MITETFGSGANVFSMDFVTIGNPGNVADTAGYPNPAGSVGYIYNLGKHEVSRGMIEKANAAGTLGITMSDMLYYGGNGVNRPATGVTWSEAATYVNWLNTSKGYQAAYKFSGSTFQLWSAGDAGYNAENMYRNNLAKYVMVSSDEWYKGAFGNPNGSWSSFPNGSDSAPTSVSSGTAANTAVYYQSSPADIDYAGGLSAWGTMGQAGNVYELNETAYDGINNKVDEAREFRGGSWNYGPVILAASYRGDWDSTGASAIVGFRVAMIPEPSSLSLLALGGLILAFKKRRQA